MALRPAWVRDIRPGVRCTARRTNGEPCRAFAVHGATVCVAHGGRAPQVRQAAIDRLYRERLETEMRAYGREYAAQCQAEYNRQMALRAQGRDPFTEGLVEGALAWLALHGPEPDGAA